MKDVYVQPTEKLGVSLRWCPLSSSGKVWHVLDVHPSSPAEIAGFIPFSDFIIGSPEGTLSAGEGALGELVEEVTRHLSMYINPSSSDDRYDYGCIIQLMI
jgi:GRASP55/65 PDZ-like domain